MSYERKQLVRQAFDRLDPSGSGVITTDEILATYDTSTHPDVATGLKNASDVAEEILGQFRNGGTPGGAVTWPEFLDYYKGLSVGIDDDSYFELMIRNAWHLAGGDGMSENTTCRRVLVVHTDGSQEVVEIKDDFGLGKFDIENIGKRLLSQGVRNISSIKI
jgi:calcyphosin